MIVFISQLVMILAMLFMFINPGLTSFVIVAITWFLAYLTFLIYGIYTQQVGFVMIFVLNIFIVFLGLFIKLDRNENDE